MEKNSQLLGVGGWLALLVLGLTILGPLMGLGRISQEFESVEKTYPHLVANAAWIQHKQLSWLVFAATAAVSISAGYRLWKIHTSKSVRFAIVALWITGPLGNLAYLFVAAITFGTSIAAEMLPEIIGTFIGSCIVATIWTAYLNRSERVRNTYTAKA